MMFRCILTLLFAMTLTAMAQAQSRADIERQYQNWLVQVVWPQARAVGVSRETLQAAFSGVSLNWKLPDLVLPGMATPSVRQQFQAEFRAPARYFARNTMEGTASVGRRMAQQHARILQAIEQQTGVPGRIILAIWGRESAFGRAKIPHNVFEVLGTKAFMSTRKDYFLGELIAALRIAEEGHAPRGHMKSSWAGALGQPQFMPSSFLTYAVDGDGDGRANIWTSEADTFASIANYLARYGWVSGRDWGFEVRIPQSVSCTLGGPDQGRSIAEWERLGVRRVSGRAFPAHERSGVGYLMMPAGRKGPAFLVTPNFYVLKAYNESDLYALFVGHMGDRIQYGVGPFAANWGRVDEMLRSDVAAMQRGLEALGHDVGGADGLVGFKTRRSIGRWQEANGRTATCFPDREMVGALSR